MAETTTLTLTEFLLARIAEDEAEAREVGVFAMTGMRWKHFPEDAYNELQTVTLANTRRVLAECAAKRAIVEQWERVQRVGTNGFGPGVLRQLAAVYADHPDYDPDWA